MKILKIFTRAKKTQVRTDIYQDSVNKVGKEQFTELLKKGLKVPVVLL